MAQLQLRTKLPEIQGYIGLPLPSLDLRRYIAGRGPLQFVTLEPLPSGLELTKTGYLQGRPAKQSEGALTYPVQVKDNKNQTLTLELSIHIHQAPQADRDVLEGLWSDEEVSHKKADQWRAMLEGFPLPATETIFSDLILAEGLDRLYRQFGAIMIARTEGDPTPKGQLLELEGADKRYNVHDFGEALVGTPESIWASDSNGAGIQTAKSMAKCAHQRGWSKVELGGYHVLVDVTWQEIQSLNLSENRSMQVENYNKLIRLG